MLKDAEKRQPDEEMPEFSVSDGKYPGHRVVAEPYKFTLSKVEKICARIKQGTWPVHACGLEYVSLDGLKLAMERDEWVKLKVEAAKAENAERIRARGETDLDHWQKWDKEGAKWDPATWNLAAKAETKSESKNEHTVSATVLVVTEAEMLAGAGRKIEGDG